MISRQRNSSLLLGCLFLLAFSLPCRGQPTNLAAYQTLALRCLTPAVDTVRTLLLDPADRMPYLRTAFAEQWRQDGRTLYLAGGAFQAPQEPLVRLAYAVEEAHVAYEREKDKYLRRTVTLALRYTLAAPDGRLLREQACRDDVTDTVPASQVTALESEAFPETQAPLPEAGWLRRYLEPAVLVIATATGIYLFFSLRSGQASDNS